MTPEIIETGETRYTLELTVFYSHGNQQLQILLVLKVLVIQAINSILDSHIKLSLGI
jgi:hypothetical protein